MLSDALINGLNAYGIGSKIRALRLNKKLGLVELGTHTGLSSALLSKIERGQIYPTLPTLLRIAMVFGIGLDYFFTETKRPQFYVTRKAERVRLPSTPDASSPAYVFESLDFAAHNRKMDVYFAEFPVKGGPSQKLQHQGHELIFIIKGQLFVTIGSESVVLNEGDAVYFESDVAHSYRQQGPEPCEVIVVIQPIGQ